MNSGNINYNSNDYFSNQQINQPQSYTKDIQGIKISENNLRRFSKNFNQNFPQTLPFDKIKNNIAYNADIQNLPFSNNHLYNPQQYYSPGHNNTDKQRQPLININQFNINNININQEPVHAPHHHSQSSKNLLHMSSPLFNKSATRNSPEIGVHHIMEGFNNINVFSLKPVPKRHQSINNLEAEGQPKRRTSLFFNEKEEKGDDYSNLDELLVDIDVPLYEYARTQKGSRNLQKLLNKAEPEYIEKILNMVVNHLPIIMINTYGNYFSQKLVQCCTADQRVLILKSVIIL
jgi:hypothetical protein